MKENSPLISEVAGKDFTEQQKDRLKALDWYINELDIVIKENKEYGVLQANWRHQERFDTWLHT